MNSFSPQQLNQSRIVKRLMFVYLLSQVVSESKFFKGATWLKIFYHDSSIGDYFHNYSEVLKCSSCRKFSVIGEIDSKYKNNDKYEFLLEYPEFNKYNRWRQTHNPKDNPEVEGQKADGYEDMEIYYPGRYWGGIVKSSHTQSAFDGSTGHINWLFAIGSYEPWPEANKFPGPAIDFNTYYGVSEVLLWVRIDNTIILSTLRSKLKFAKRFIPLLGITTLLLFD